MQCTRSDLLVQIHSSCVPIATVVNMLQGAYGLVMQCKLLDDPENKVAVKLFKISETDTDAEDVKRTAHREMMLMQQLQHSNVVQCLDSFLIQVLGQSACLYLVSVRASLKRLSHLMKALALCRTSYAL
jgi:serine/threonine protein kinase